MSRSYGLLLLLAVLAGLTACNAVTSNAPDQPASNATSIATPTDGPTPIATPTDEPTSIATPTNDYPAPTAALTGPNYVVNGPGNSAVERAHAQLSSANNPIYLVIVSAQSTGLEGEIYQDLIKRDFRATTGPDEGIDTHAEFCYPNCVFVQSQAVNAIGVNSWLGVLKHEYRHVMQATNNPTMAQDFRGADGDFTTYAAFSEACADYGLNVAPMYQAPRRIDTLKNALGAEQQGLIDQACNGDKSAYEKLEDAYNQKTGDSQRFVALFPPFH